MISNIKIKNPEMKKQYENNYMVVRVRDEDSYLDS